MKSPISGLCSCEPAPNSPNPYEVDPNSCGSEAVPQSQAVHFADLDGDGRAEYLWVDADGAVTAWHNGGGPDNGPNAAKINWITLGIVASGVGGKRHQIQFADLNGDGRAEYLWVHDNGSVNAWLNIPAPTTGPNAGKPIWLPQGMIATGIGTDGAGVRFADLNGDGRAEYLWVDSIGAVTAYLNLPAPDQGPNAAKPGWLPAGVIATGVGGKRENTYFADIDGDGRADYLYVSHVDGSVKEWYNAGGPDNGPHAANVVWIPNTRPIASGVGTDGKGVQFADLNGDGRAEYLDVNPDTSAVNAWLNVC